MEKHYLLEAKYRELSEAFNDALDKDNMELARMYNAELIPIEIRLMDAVRNSKANRRADS